MVKISPFTGKRTMQRILSGQRILVSGANGFIGTNLCRRLLALGSEVHGTSRQAQNSGAVHWHRTEWLSRNEVEKTLHKSSPDVVIHLAGHVSALPNQSLVNSTFQSLLSSTVYLLQAATSARVSKVIITGSTEEAAATAPNSPYAAAKASASLYCEMFYKLYNTPVINVRPAMTFGPHQAEHKLIPYVIDCVQKGLRPQLSSGARLADWIYVSDVVEGFVAAILEKDIEGMSFELGTGQLRSTQCLVDTLLQVLGSPIKPNFGAIDDRPGESPRAASTGAAKCRLSWSAKTSLDDALRETASWYLRKGIRSACA